MSLDTPAWLQAGEYSATLDRLLIDVLFDQGGVVGLTDLAVTQRAAGANRSVDVAAGKCVIPGTNISNQGKNVCRSTAVVNVPLDTAPGSGQSRIDRIVAQVIDSAAVGGSDDEWQIIAVKGTAATSPTLPSAPASSIDLASVLVGSNVTTITNANVTDRRAWASPFTRPSVGTIGPPSAGSYAGQPICLLFGQISGTTDSSARRSVTFPNGGFPNGVLGVVPLPNNNNLAGIMSYTFNPQSGTVTKTGFIAQCFNLGAESIVGSSAQVVWAPSQAVAINYMAIGF